jgi:hypothetical protein
VDVLEVAAFAVEGAVEVDGFVCGGCGEDAGFCEFEAAVEAVDIVSPLVELVE